MRLPRIVLAFCLLVAPAKAAEGDGSAIPLESLDAFMAAAEPLVPESIRGDRKLWRQIAASVRWTLIDHAESLRRLPEDRQKTAVGEVAGFIVEVRKKHASTTVIGLGRPITALLDPDRGLEPKQITALAAAYGTRADVLKREGPQTLQEVADSFLRAICDRAGSDAPSTIVVVGHGLPREIQSYAIPVERVAEALVDGGARRAESLREGKPAAVDLSAMVLVFDDCFSADFCLNLAREIRRAAAKRSLIVGSLPVFLAGANRDRYGLVDIGEKFVTHYWDSVIELYFVRKPHPTAVTIGDFQGHIDNFMYGHGRVPVFEGSRIVDYRLVDPRLVQDPVCFVPLSPEDVARLREIFGMPDTADPLPLLDAG